MVVEKETAKTTDSGAEPYIVQKGVVLCRSGIQLYHHSELNFDAIGGKPPVEKEWYREYRPASVVVKAKDKCRSLNVTKEHPDDWVTPDNWRFLSGGDTDKSVDVIALDGESEGEIGLASDITFRDRSLYDYYMKGNKEVSLGYTCKKHFVPNPEEVGYDIVLDEICDVNHVAVTCSGRGGSSVAVIDSMLGGLKPMRTGLFSWLKSKKKTDSELSFGQTVFDAVKNSKGTTEEELAEEMKGVMDSCSILPDGEQKTKLIDAVKDCFDNKALSVANEADLISTLNAEYEKAVKDSADSFNKEEKKEKEEEKTDDSCGEEKPEEGVADSDENEEEAKTDTSKDSLEGMKDEIISSVSDSLKEKINEIVEAKVKELIGVTNDNKTPEQSPALDSEHKEATVTDYSFFLDD